MLFDVWNKFEFLVQAVQYNQIGYLYQNLGIIQEVIGNMMRLLWEKRGHIFDTIKIEIQEKK